MKKTADFIFDLIQSELFCEALKNEFRISKKILYANGKVTYNGRLMVFPAGVKLSAQNKKRLGFTGYLINE